MKCLQCGHATKGKKVDKYHYRESGLKNIYLNNILQFECSHCGEVEIALPNVEALHRLIAKDVASQEARLKPEEIRFLRVHLGFSGADFARTISVEPETVSRWETGKTEMKLTLERFLRVMILSNAEPFRDYARLELFGSTERKVRPKRQFTVSGERWVEAA